MRNSSFQGSFSKSKRKMTPRVYLPVLLGLFSMVLSLVGALLLRQGKLQAENSATKLNSQFVPVQSVAVPVTHRVLTIVPKVEIPPGSNLTPDMFEASSALETEVSSTALRGVAEVQGFYAKALLIPGIPVTREYITAMKPSSEVISEIPEGFRAVTIRVDERTSVEGWARAGARVDIVWSTISNGEPVISVLVENAKILSAERQVSSQPEPAAQKPDEKNKTPTTVTLLVNADDAQRIQLATVSGSMSLSLRGLNDSKSNYSGPLTISDLLSNGKDVTPNKPKVVLQVHGAKGDKVQYALKDGELVEVE